MVNQTRGVSVFLPWKGLMFALILIVSMVAVDRHYQADAQALNATQEFVFDGNVTSAGLLKSFGFSAKTLVVTNTDATNSIFISIAGPTPTATTGSYTLTKGATLTLSDLNNVTKISLIVSSTTATVSIGAWR